MFDFKKMFNCIYVLPSSFISSMGDDSLDFDCKYERFKQWAYKILIQLLIFQKLGRHTFILLGGVGVYVSGVCLPSVAMLVVLPFTFPFISGKSLIRSSTCCRRMFKFLASFWSERRLLASKPRSSSRSRSWRSFSRRIFSLLVRSFAWASRSSSRSHWSWWGKNSFQLSHWREEK